MPETYVELHCHSCYSLLDGASFPEDLVARAAALGMSALALTDHDALYGAMRFVHAAKAQGIQPILGAELTLTDGSHLTLLVENETGWHNLCYLISRGRRNAPQSESALALTELAGYTNGLIALSGCRKGAIAAALQQHERSETALAIARHYQELFGEGQFFIELQRHFLPGEERLISRLTALASYLHLPLVATNNVHYALPDGHRLQDVLVCIRHLTTLDESLALRRPNSEYYLKSPAQMADLFPGYPQALENTLLIAERCRFELHYGLQELPLFAAPHGLSSQAYLNRLCEESIPDGYGETHAPMACSFVTFRARSAWRDVAKVLGLRPDILGQAERILEGQGEGLAAAAPVQQLLDLCQQIEGLPRRLGIHSGGMVITGAPVMGRVATEPATMTDRMVVQEDKEGREEAGLVKIAPLGLLMLSAIRDAVKLIEAMSGTSPDLARLTFDDPDVYDMISQTDTLGVFPWESRVQAQMLPRLRPRTLADLVVAISLIRPGSTQGNGVHSHAAAFAVLVYQSAWLKRYHPIPFYTALLNNQPMGFWNAAVIVNEMQRRMIPILPVDVQLSQWPYTIEGVGIRIGLCCVQELGAIVAE